MTDATRIRDLVLGAMTDPRATYGIHEIKDAVRAVEPATTLTELQRSLLTMSGEGRIRATGSGPRTRYSRRT